MSIDGDLKQEYEKVLLKLSQKFLASCGLKKVDALRVNLKQLPFKDFEVIFMREKKIFTLELSSIKDQKLLDLHDSLLAEIFLELTEKELFDLKTQVENTLILNFVKKNILQKAQKTLKKP